MSFLWAICPFSYCQSLDEHILRSLYFYDDTIDFLCGIKIGLEASFALNKNISLVLFAKHMGVGTLLGSSIGRSKTESVWTLYASGAGASFREEEAGLSLRVFLF